MTSGSTKAFTRDTTKDSYATTPGGDNYPQGQFDVHQDRQRILRRCADAQTDIVLGTRTDLTTGNTPNSAKAGYTPAGTTFNGYTEGPGYWGKTFFVWPPDPRGSDLDANTAANHADNGAKDWRQRFFFKKNTGTSTSTGSITTTSSSTRPARPTTTDSSGLTPILKHPQDTTDVTENGVTVTYRYCINYAAIFHWLRTDAHALSRPP